MRALVVDDDPTSAAVLEQMLQPHFTVTIARNGREGLSIYYQSLTENQPFDVIFLDIMMPELSGHDVLEEIRRHEAKTPEAGQARVVMTTALDDMRHILRSSTLGCQAYLTKPISRIRLNDELSKLGLVSWEPHE